MLCSNYPSHRFNLLKADTDSHSGTFVDKLVIWITELRQVEFTGGQRQLPGIICGKKCLLTEDSLRRGKRSLDIFFKFIVAGQDSPFWTLDAGGCMKSLKGTSASLSAEQTSEDEQALHSTRVGYKAITCAQVFPSTVMQKYKNLKKVD